MEKTQIIADTNKKFLYKDLSYKIIGCFYKVYNELGPAHKEQIYHEALKIAFTDDKIIIEIKSVFNMLSVFEKQLYYYLRGTKYKVGYLVNFGSEEIDIRRRIYESVRKVKSA